MFARLNDEVIVITCRNSNVRFNGRIVGSEKRRRDFLTLNCNKPTMLIEVHRNPYWKVIFLPQPLGKSLQCLTHARMPPLASDSQSCLKSIHQFFRAFYDQVS